jgi:hypothetical protein
MIYDDVFPFQSILQKTVLEIMICVFVLLYLII